MLSSCVVSTERRIAVGPLEASWALSTKQHFQGVPGSRELSVLEFSPDLLPGI